MPLSAKQKEEIEELFFLFDRDFDDAIDAQEFATVRIRFLFPSYSTNERKKKKKLEKKKHEKKKKQAGRAFGDQGGYPTPSELVDYMDGQDKMSKSRFVEIMTKRVLVHNVCEEAEFFFLTKGNPFACLDDEGKGCNGKAFRKCFMNLADKFNEKEYADIWTNLGMSKPGDDENVDLDGIYAKLQDALKK